MSVNNEFQSQTGGATIEKTLPHNGVYASLFNKINLTPVAEIGDLNGFEDNTIMAETSADARVTAAVQVFMQCLQKSGQKVEKLDKTLLDHHIAELDFQISRQLDEVMHSDEFQKVESIWRGLKSLVDKTDFRQNVKIEILDLSKDELRQDFEDSPEIIQSGLYRQTYTMEYDTPGGEPIAAVISAYEFDASAQDVALMRNISKVSAAAHMPFIGSAGPAFFMKSSMEEVAAIKDIGNYFDRAEYIKWKSFRETDDSRYLGLVMPRVLGRLPYGPDNGIMNQSPGWRLRYGQGLVSQAKALWPDDPATRELVKRWEQYQMARTQPASKLQGWNEGMTQLQALSAKLDALDHQKGKYLTGSELKTMVWQITRSFASAVPAEEQLRQLVSAPGEGNTPGVSIEEASRHLDSLSFILLTAQ